MSPLYNSSFGTRLTKWITHLIGVKWTIRQGELLREQSSCIIISNHQHSLDVLGMFQFWDLPDKMTVVAKSMLKYCGPFGLASWYCKLMFIDRTRGDRKLMNDAMGELIKSDTKLWIFPEGTRRNKNQVHDFKKGAFYMAVNHQIPLQPLVYSSYKHFINEDKKTFDNGEIIMTAMPRISTVGLTEADIPALIERTKKMMEEVYQASSEEARSRVLNTPINLSEKLEKFKAKLEGRNKEPVVDTQDFVKEAILKPLPTLEKTIN